MLRITQCDGTWDALQLAIVDMAAIPTCKGILVFAGEKNGAVTAQFNAFLKQLQLPILGGVFPALIYQGQSLESGNLVLGFEVDVDVHVTPSLSDATIDYDAFLSKTICHEKLIDHHTMFVFVDGLAPRVGALIESLFNTFGLEGNFIGGGAGSLTTADMPCLITSQGVIRDAAVIAVPQLFSRVSVGHGWLPLEGPFEVTESDNNVIISLDWEPALDVYKKAIEAFNGKLFDQANFGQFAQSHPFGIARLNAEFVVRDPIALRDDTALVCVGDVPRGSLVYIMQGDVRTLLSAANKVRQMSDLATPPELDARVDIFIDCISRSLFLGSDISKELASVRHPNFPQLGAFTLGEIANSEQEYLEFHNKTAVVATIWEPNERA